MNVFHFSNFCVSVLRYKEHLLPSLSTTSETKLSNIFSDIYSLLKRVGLPCKVTSPDDLIQLDTLLSCSVPEAYFNTILLMFLSGLSFHYFYQLARVVYDYFYNSRPKPQDPQALREEAEDIPRQ